MTCAACKSMSKVDLERELWSARSRSGALDVLMQAGWRKSGAGMTRPCDACARPLLEAECAELRERIEKMRTREFEYQQEIRTKCIQLEGANIAAVNLMQATARQITHTNQLASTIEETRKMSELTKHRPMPASPHSSMTLAEDAFSRLSALHPMDAAAIQQAVQDDADYEDY